MATKRKMTQEEADVEKTIATTRLMLAKAEGAEIENEIDRARLRNETALAQVAEYNRREAEINLTAIERVEQAELARDGYHHVYYFGSDVNRDAVRECVESLTYWHRTAPGCDIEIVFNSPGGGVIAGMELFDFIRLLSDEGHVVTTKAMGYAASMGGILLQAGTVRKMGREAYILIHEISAATYGKLGQMEDDVEFYKKMCERVINLFVDRSGGKLSREKIVENWTRKDWWIDSDTALSLGIVDEVF